MTSPPNRWTQQQAKPAPIGQGQGAPTGQHEDVWDRTTHGISANIAGRRCEVTRVPATVPGSRPVMRASIEGFTQNQLANDGIVVDFREGKQLVRDALISAGIISNAPRGSSSSRFPPHPVEIRLRCIDAATNMMTSLGLPPATEAKDLEIRLQQLKILAAGLEAYALEANGVSVKPL